MFFTDNRTAKLLIENSYLILQLKKLWEINQDMVALIRENSEEIKMLKDYLEVVEKKQLVKIKVK